jgi:hypothetical protein
VKVRNLSIPQRDFILNMAGVVTTILFFISGVGSYRIFIVYTIEEILKGSKLIQKTVLLGALAYILSAYWDIKSGPIIFPSTGRYFSAVFFAFVVVRLMIQKSFKRLISDITQNQYFETCPACHYHNSYLVGSCSNCDYKKGDVLPASPSTLSAYVKGDKISSTLINLLSLGQGEEVLFHKSLDVFTNKFINGKRMVRKDLVITSANVIILDYKCIPLGRPTGWTTRDIIPLSEVTAIQATMKDLYMSRRPFLVIKTSQKHVYEIGLSTVGKYVADIKHVIDTLNKNNPQIELGMNIALPYSNEQKSSTSTWQMLVLIIILMITVFYALWQSFPHLADWGLK